MLLKIALGIIGAFVAVNIVVAVVVVVTQRDRDLSIPETVIDFEQAVYGGNFEAMWDLSAPEYRDGLTRDQFIERARQTGPTPDRLFDWTVLNEDAGDIARAHTRVQLASGGIPSHRIMLRKIDGEWLIVSYEDYDGPWPPTEPPLSAS